MQTSLEGHRPMLYYCKWRTMFRVSLCLFKPTMTRRKLKGSDQSASQDSASSDKVAMSGLSYGRLILLGYADSLRYICFNNNK